MGVTGDGEIDSETCGPYHVLLLVRAHGVDYMRVELPFRILFFWDAILCHWVVSSWHCEATYCFIVESLEFQEPHLCESHKNCQHIHVVCMFISADFKGVSYKKIILQIHPFSDLKWRNLLKLQLWYHTVWGSFWCHKCWGFGGNDKVECVLLVVILCN